DEFVRRNFLVVENGVLKVAEGVKIFVKSMKNILVNTHKATQNVVKTTKVGQWMSKTQYDQFVKTGIIPNSNVLTKGKKGYERQANKGNYYVEFDIDASLLMPKDIELGWAPVKSKNEMQLKLAKNKGITLPDPIGTNITHVDTKR
ncbi:hypothetical protein AB4Z29_32265, partial [Paenibacillus sp. 2TAB23]|uniref:TreTu family toxin n=1 Tax=Paenibacillus sp. 2TAB23 TaxID=3233004 RepID=UPI003F97BDF7